MPSNKYNQKFNFNKILHSRLFLAIGVAVLILVSVALSKEVVRRYAVNREINQLKKDVGDLEKRNAELADLIQYINTEDFQEKEDRTKLGLAKPGEKVIVIPDIPEQQTVEGTNNLPANLEEMSNPQRWWNYFFSQ